MDALKTLLIDHHDSYTYNLFQLLTEVNGEEPVVILHDSPECLDPNLLDLSDPSGRSGLAGLSRFDNIVVSPGPGHPADPRDFGATAQLIERSPIPVLGVCLGHQGIALGAQARVVAAPEPRHGHLSRIRHGERGLFRGLPQDFTAVRYHSLCVAEPLPLPLQAIAWSEDGVLMALRHRTRPLWGVQFHPESVLTGYGHRILANFRDLTREYAAMTADESSAPPPAAARPVKHRELANTAPAAAAYPPAKRTAVAEDSVGYRLHSRWLAVPIDTEAAFTRLYADAPRAFWLDSARTRSGEARFSFLGDGRGPLAEFVRYDVSRGACEVERAGKPVTHVPGSVFDHLKKELARRRVAAPTLPFDFTGGYIGYFGYELKADCGSTNRHEAKTPDACWLFADRFLAVDHQEGVTYALCLTEDTPDGHREAAEWLDDTITTLTGLPVGGELAPPPTASGATTAAVEPWLVRGRERYLADIEACQRELRAGTSYEICLTDSAWLPAPDDSYAFYRALRRLNPAPYAAFLRFGEADVACASPERFLRVSPGRTAEARPIKGTAPRGRNADEDARARATLATSPKTRAENLMIVDLLRNDLGRVCAPGTVRVPDLMHTETYATVHQLVSTVRGRLHEDRDAVDCVRACFPGGSMTGAPKERTLEIIDTLETEARGVYSGALGFLSCNGAADLNIVIRTAVFTGGRMHIGAGGAIVLASDPEEEYQEMLLKTAATMRAYHDVGALPPGEPPESTGALVAASAPAEEADR